MEQKKKSNETRQITAIVVLLTVLALVCAALATVFSSAARRAPKAQGTEPPKTETSAPARRPSESKKPAAAETDPPGEPAIEPREEEPLPVSVTLTWVLPVEGSTVSKGFDEKALVFSQTMGDYRVHTAVDLACPLGADVLAAADGVIGRIWTDPFEGVCLSLQHENGYVTVYKNLAPAFAPGMIEGNHVAGGQVIASVGETSAVEIAEEAHLHFEMQKDGTAIDPLSVVPYDHSVISYTE